MARRPLIDVQFFAEEKTEDATAHKRDKVRGEGRVCTSKDLGGAVSILTGLAGMVMLGPFIVRTLTDLMQSIVRFMGDGALLRGGWTYLVGWEATKDLFLSWLPLGCLIALIATAVIIRQVGWRISFEPFQLKFDRFNPVSGMKKIISMRSLVELVKGLLKCCLFGVIIYKGLREYLPVTTKTMQMPLGVGAAALWDMLWTLAMRLAMLLLVLGFADYAYQRWDFEKSIKMSKQEVKEEFKQMEGDPQIKSKIRQKQREMAKQRMMADVPKADVVITNPTTLAIALAYDRALMGAPQVVAKGRGFVAQRIRLIAEENGVPIIENKPLAWALFEGVEVGEEIPEDLYRGVAEILAMVYRLKAS